MRTSISSTAPTGPTRSTSWPSYRQPARKAGRLCDRADAADDGTLAEGLDDGRVQRFLDAMWKKPKLSLRPKATAIMNVCMAATYDPDPEAPHRLSPAVPPRNRRSAATSAGALAAPRPREPGDKYAANLRSLQRASTSTAAGATSTTSITARGNLSRALEKAGDRAPLRGIRRRPLRHRLSHGREPALPLSRAAALR